jgi:hypothetical protein
MGEDIYKASLEEKIAEMQSGLLYRYCPDLEIYTCPNRIKDVPRTYSLVDGMNGFRDVPGTSDLIIKKMTNIRNTSMRGAFIDEGIPTHHTWTVNYESPLWWDWVPLQHVSGTTLSFADGHCEFWKWANQQTFDRTRLRCDKQPHDCDDELRPDNEDLSKCIKMVWGKTGF